MSDSRDAAICYFNLNAQKALTITRRGFFVLALKSKNQERGTKNQEQPRSGSLIQHSLFNIHHSDRRLRRAAATPLRRW